MAKNYFNKLRKSYVAGTLATTMLSNLMVFGQPMQQMLSHVHYLDTTPPRTKTTERKKVSPSKEKTFTPSYIFYAHEKQATIGKAFPSDRENPGDNFFSITIPDSLDLDNYQAIMAYDLYGLAQASHTTKSINGYPAYGGKIIGKTQAWTLINEYIPTGYLQPGTNEIFFTRRVDKNYQYKIKNISIQLIEKGDEAAHLIEKKLVNYGGDLYVMGMFSNPAIQSIEVEGKQVPVINGIFEVLLQDISQNTKKIHISYGTTEDKNRKFSVDVHYQEKKTKILAPMTTIPEKTPNIFFLSSLVSLQNFYSAGLAIDKKHTAGMDESQVSIKGLAFKDLKPTGEIENVTEEGFLGYRVYRDKVPDSIPVQLHLKYDPDKIPDGYTPRDVKTYFFDKEQRNWKALPVDSLDLKNNTVVSSLVPNPETDYINGIIKVPENPETAAFAPTAMSDIEFANPAAGVVSIPPPTPNNMGSAGTQFPIKLPKGRNGMQPSLAVSYSSEAGNGWMGLGWNIQIPAISLNTKWGVPTFGANETEIYSLNGEDLVLHHNGEYTNPHRSTANIPRQTDRIFYLRKEGSYLKVVRKGSGPTNYRWEVSDKYGNKSFYGGVSGVNNNYVLRDGDNNIAHWALARKEDPYGNYVDYEYVKNTVSVTNNAQSTITGTEFHIEKISYTLHGSSTSNYYQIEFLSNSYLPNPMLSARNGFLQITKDRLDEIKISFEGTNPQPIRSYKFHYSPGAFGKSLLTKIEEYDADGDLFYSNTMEYYDEVGSSPIISNTNKSWNGQSDQVSSPLHTIATAGFGNVIPKGSALGTSVSSGFSFGLRTSVGIGFNPMNVNTSIGGSGNYSQSTQDTRIVFMDINGDGLPDKIYSNDNGVYYRPNTGSDFGNLIQVGGIDRLGKTKSRTTGWGFDANVAGLVGVGKSGSTTRTVSNYYFTDFNGDGLPDMAKNNFIYFNRTKDGADYTWREFDNQVGTTENPIEAGTIDDAIASTLDLPTLPELRSQHPQFDHVKVWRAPYTGSISFTSEARLIVKNDCDFPQNSSHTNSYKLTVEHGNNSFSGDAIPLKTQFLSTPNPSPNPPVHINSSSNISVTKGDFIFFRVHNQDYGCGGQVEWEPKITYVSIPPNISGAGIQNIRDEHGKYYRVFDAEEDFIINNGSASTPSNDDTQIDIFFNLLNQDFSPYQFSDEVNFVVERIRTEYNSQGEQTVDANGNPIFQTTQWIRTYDPITGDFGNQGNQISNVVVNTDAPGSNTYRYAFYFYAESDSNVQWENISWKPTYTGTNSGTVYPPVTYKTYDSPLTQERDYFGTFSSLPVPNIDPNLPNDGETPLVRISHDLLAHTSGQFNLLDAKNFPVKVNWVTKEKTTSGATNISKVLHKRTFYVQRTTCDIMSNNCNYIFFTDPNDPVNSTLSAADPADAEYFEFELTKEKVEDLRGNTGRIYSSFYINNEKFPDVFPGTVIKLENLLDSNYPIQKIHSPYVANTFVYYGFPHRGWGQFLYNGGLTSDLNPLSGPINLEVLKKDPASQGEIDILKDQINEDDPDNMNIEKTIFYTLYNQDNQSNRYVNTSILDAAYGYNIDGTSTLTATTGRFGEKNLFAIYVDPDFLSDPTFNPNNLFIGLKQRSKSKGDAESGDLGSFKGTLSDSESHVLNQYVDLNGDRYPDIVTKGDIQYTDMLGGLTDRLASDDLNYSPGFVTGDKGEDNTFGATISGIQPNSTESANAKSTGNKTVTNINSGLNTSEGYSFNARQWIDINGDGLTDQVTLTQSEVKVSLNTGYGFEPEILWGDNYTLLKTSKRSNASVSPSFGQGLDPTSSFAVGFGLSKGDAKTNASLVDVNGDGLPDLVIKNISGNHQYYLNTGIGFSTNPQTFAQSSIGEIGENRSTSGNIFGSITAGPVVPLLLITLKFPITVSGGVNASFSQTVSSLGDINGDGLPDVLHKSNDNASVSANLNKVGKTNLLKQVNLPLGGSWTVDYAKKGNTYDMPQHKWVMSEVKIHDGFTGDNNFDPLENLTTFKYENGKYDRRDREFFGFESLTTEQWETATASGDPYRYTVKKYHNQDYYFKGMLKEVATYRGDNNQLLSRTQNFYNLFPPIPPSGSDFTANTGTSLDEPFIDPAVGDLDRTRAFPALVKSISSTYEGTQSLSLVQEFTKYDEHGNLTEYHNRGTGGQDAYTTEIGYDDANYTGLPTQVKVTVGGTLMRQRNAEYNSNGKAELMTIKLNANETNRIQFQYDDYGNTELIKQLDNIGAQGGPGGPQMPFKQNIGYDPVVHTYPVEFSDSFGQSSSAEYDYLFGIPVLVTDMNNNKMRTRIDDRGRVVEVTSPNEINLYNANDRWTIRNVYWGETGLDSKLNGLNDTEYRIDTQGQFTAANPGQQQPPTNRQHWALTRHHIEDNNPSSSYSELETLSIVDGLGEAIQLKKKHFMDGTTTVWQISGKENKDAFGRPVEQYLPTIQSFSLGNTGYQSSANATPPTMISYDHRDRKESMTDPLNNTTNFFYGIEDGLFYNEVVNPKSQTQKTYTDTRGRKRKTVQNGQITTEFFYNAVNELMKVRNTEGYETKYEYDLAGRRTKEMHPDRGMTSFTYNKIGQVTQKQTANLMQGTAGEIEYSYNYHRLTNIVYPNHPENNVEYVYGTTTAGNGMGRVIQQKDATGIQWFRYGKLGELTFAGRAIAVAGKTSYWFTTSWEYDSWNRIQKITYPDAEKVIYKYDLAGQLQAIESNYNNVQNPPNSVDPVTNITYNQYGERKRIDYGNGTYTVYAYDDLRRLSTLNHQFATHGILKQYVYDELSNVTQIATDPSLNFGILPTNGELAGPTLHHYEYDEYNRLIKANGWYIGPDDAPSDLLRQEYTLDMTYDKSHNLIQKAQNHVQGTADNLNGFLNGITPKTMEDTTYTLDYEDYAGGTFTAEGYSYVQPHAPRTIVQYPLNGNPDPDNPRVKVQLLDYDANGNLLSVQQEISDPEDPLGKAKISLRENLWDEEDRLRAVDLKPEAPNNKPEVAAYTYDAEGQRIVKYLPGRVDAYYSAKAAGSADRLESILYPSPLLTVKTRPLPDGINPEVLERTSITKYTKHYYIGTERISSAIGTMKNLGLLCENVWPGSQGIIDEMGDKTAVATEILIADYNIFEKELQLPEPYRYETYICTKLEHDAENYDAYWYHPDHLGSSSYITNTSGEVSQHMEYLPFGETLVEEHLNSYNSPYKFNAKEFDAETGWYYYGARYYSPKYNLMLGVDPYANIYPASSPYSYVNNNPINAVDINGRYIIFIGGLRIAHGARDQAGHIYNGLGGKTGIYKTDVFDYWSTEKNTFGREANIDEYYMSKYNDHNVGYASGSSYWNSQASGRMEEGRQKARQFHKMVQDGTIVLADDETIKIISHSQGGAHAAGFAQELKKYVDECGGQIYNIEVIEYITPHQPKDINHPDGIPGIQYSHENDQISSRNYLPNGGTEFGKIPGILDQNFHQGDIMGGPGQPPANIFTRGGHNVEDNDKFIKRGEVFRSPRNL